MSISSAGISSSTACRTSTRTPRFSTATGRVRSICLTPSSTSRSTTKRGGEVAGPMSARYHINDISALLRGKKVAIIGLGGTGAYILDFIARTHLERIALFDDDKVHVHTIFRVPGFIPGAIKGLKVDALARQYGHWH